MIRYSPTTGGFYSAEIHRDAVPVDTVPISDARHRRLLALQAAGATISARDDGHPQARRERSNVAELRDLEIVATKSDAARRIDLVAPIWRQLNDIAEVHLMSAEQLAARDARQVAIRSIRAASDRIEAEIAGAGAAELRALDVLHHPYWPEA